MGKGLFGKVRKEAGQGRSPAWSNRDIRASMQLRRYTSQIEKISIGVFVENSEKGLGLMHVVLTLIFCRGLQVPLLIEACSISWLERFFYEHVLRSDGRVGFLVEGFISIEDPHQPDVVQLTIPKYS